MARALEITSIYVCSLHLLFSFFSMNTIPCMIQHSPPFIRNRKSCSSLPFKHWQNFSSYLLFFLHLWCDQILAMSLDQLKLYISKAGVCHSCVACQIYTILMFVKETSFRVTSSFITFAQLAYNSLCISSIICWIVVVRFSVTLFTEISTLASLYPFWEAPARGNCAFNYTLPHS